ncbi:MAG: ATP-dependent sacrificial sulfur transferase LarE [Gemmataceae bacterium]|nr:ATP-dependent sacrificial sulfur transferase LarE [Gemmataceae bacterium]
MDDLSDKRDRLLAVLASLGRVAVAFSGGVDSAVVAKAAAIALGADAVAVTADSPSVPRAELAEAVTLADSIGIRHLVVRTAEFDDPAYAANDGARCYFCKTELYNRIESLLPELGIDTICSGANLDDAGDYRPGLMAAAEHHVRHPLQEAGFTKADVRELAKQWRLPVWDKPASPCLSSRLAPGLAVTPERTLRIERAETFLRELGMRVCRVRYHEGDLARIEVEPEQLERLAGSVLRKRIDEEFRRIGFRFVSLDLTGFQSGSLNQLVPLELKMKFAATPGGRP